MGDAGCEEITTWFTYTGSKMPDLRRELLGIARMDETDFDAIADLVERYEPSLASLFREELRELPRPALLAMLRAWRDAAEHGTSFTLMSERPESPLTFARRRLVRVVTDVDDTGITVRLSHIPGRHPQAFRERPAGEAVAV